MAIFNQVGLSCVAIWKKKPLRNFLWYVWPIIFISLLLLANWPRDELPRIDYMYIKGCKKLANMSL